MGRFEGRAQESVLPGQVVDESRCAGEWMLTANPLLMLADQLDPDMPFVDDPVGWAKEKTGAYLWSKQVEIAQSVVDNRYTAVYSCHSSGKSFEVGGILAPWWIDTHPIGQAFVVTSAPSAAQVEAIIWQEIGNTHRKAELPGRLTGGGVPKWKIGDQLVAFGRKPQDLANEEEARQAFQGIHRKYVLVLLDEAGGIPSWLWDAALSLVTNEFCRMVAIGNPDDPTSRFKEVCLNSKNWNAIHIDGYDTPNFTDEWIPEELGHLLLSKQWVEDMREEWGEDSPIFEAKVRGRFPEDSQYAAIPWSYLSRCRNLDVTYLPFEEQPNELGIDPAAGGDQFAVHWRTGPKWRGKWGFSYKDTNKSVDECIRIIEETGATRVKIDTIGLGKGVADNLTKELRQQEIDCEVVEVQVSVASDKPKRFRNLRDQLWWEVGRKMLEHRQADLTDLDDRTAHQLTSVRYEIKAGGKVEIEPKVETKSRIKRSPDDADAFLLCYYVPASSKAGSLSKLEAMSEPTIRRGDLVLKGAKYVDK